MDIFPNSSAIPEELRAERVWVCWRAEPDRNGKPTKVPYSPETGRKADSTDPATWTDFSAAILAARKYDGIGCVVTPPRADADLDGCRDPQSEELEPWAAEVVRLLGSYTEITPSRAGLRVWIKGNLPAGRRKWGGTVNGTKRGFEFYDAARYYTVTGDHVLGTPKTIEQRDPLPAYVVGSYFDSPKFIDLWLGEWQKHGYPSQSEADLALATLIAKKIGPDPTAIDQVFRSSRLFRPKWDERHGTETYGERTIRTALGGGDDFPTGPSTQASRHEPEPTEEVPGRILITELSNAERLLAKHADDLRFAADRGVWLMWTNKFWAADDLCGALRLTTGACREIYFEAGAAPDKDLRSLLSAWARKSESRRVIENSLSLARFDSRVEVRKYSEVFDRHPLLLNVANGTIDLVTGEIRPHRREDFLTKIVSIEYDETATCPRFLDFLEQTFLDPEMIGYIRRFAGLCLTGLTSEQSWWMFYGPTASGKSTTLKILHGTLGPYAFPLPDNYFLVSKNASDFVTANLAGRRLATCVETNEGRLLDVAKIKMLTGQDPVSAAFKFQNYFEFLPEAKLVLATNHRPRIPATDDSIWRRVKVVPFTVTVPEEKRIKDLAETLVAEEAPGILRWAVDGCREWLRQGNLGEPAAIKSAGAEYRKAEDIVADFLSECCERNSTARTPRREMSKAFAGWTRTNHAPTLTGKKLATELERLGVEKDASDPQRFWGGIRLCKNEGF